jgi:hypothetical protein
MFYLFVTMQDLENQVLVLVQVQHNSKIIMLVEICALRACHIWLDCL